MQKGAMALSQLLLNIKCKYLKGWKAPAAVFIVFRLGDQYEQTVDKQATAGGTIQWDHSCSLQGFCQGREGAYELAQPLIIEVCRGDNKESIVQHPQKLPKLTVERPKSFSVALPNGMTLYLEVVARRPPGRSPSVSSASGPSTPKAGSSGSSTPKRRTPSSSAGTRGRGDAGLSGALSSKIAAKRAGSLSPKNPRPGATSPKSPKSASRDEVKNIQDEWREFHAKTFPAAANNEAVIGRDQRLQSFDAALEQVYAPLKESFDNSIRDVKASNFEKLEDGSWHLEEGKMVRREVYRMSHGPSECSSLAIVPSAPEQMTTEQWIQRIRSLTDTQQRDLHMYILGLEREMSSAAAAEWAASFINPLKTVCPYCRQSFVWMVLIAILLQRSYTEFLSLQQLMKVTEERLSPPRIGTPQRSGSPPGLGSPPRLDSPGRPTASAAEGEVVWQQKLEKLEKQRADELQATAAMYENMLVDVTQKYDAQVKALQEQVAKLTSQADSGVQGGEPGCVQQPESGVQELQATAAMYEKMLVEVEQKYDAQVKALQRKVGELMTQMDDSVQDNESEHTQQLKQEVQALTEELRAKTMRIMDLEDQLFSKEPSGVSDHLPVDVAQERAHTEHLESRVLMLQLAISEKEEQHRLELAHEQAAAEKADRWRLEDKKADNEAITTLQVQVEHERNRAEVAERQLEALEGVHAELSHERTRAQTLEMQLQQLQADGRTSGNTLQQDLKKAEEGRQELEGVLAELRRERTQAQMLEMQLQQLQANGRTSVSTLQQDLRKAEEGRQELMGRLHAVTEQWEEHQKAEEVAAKIRKQASIEMQQQYETVMQTTNSRIFTLEKEVQEANLQRQQLENALHEATTKSLEAELEFTRRIHQLRQEQAQGTPSIGQRTSSSPPRSPAPAWSTPTQTPVTPLQNNKSSPHPRARPPSSPVWSRASGVAAYVRRTPVSPRLPRRSWSNVDLSKAELRAHSCTLPSCDLCRSPGPGCA